MAKSIDERVVSLRVNDREFQSAIDNVVKSLDGLKKSLKFKDTAKGFTDLDRAASNVKFDGLTKAAANVRNTVANIASEAQKTFSSMSTSGVESVGTISQSFSALQAVAFGALTSIGAEVTNVGKNITSMFTQGITSGLSEYELQMNSIQTILTNTASKGTTLDQVNAALAELNTYADQTIYNFSQMTQNIGTFTAAGVDLDTAVASIKGIANLAAASGSSASQAASAMYQLSQAIAAGRVSLMDWNSVVYAGMGGELFQNALKRTAKNFGTDVDAIIAKYGSFRESLTEGQWLTTEVLTETLKQISGAYTEADLVAQGYSQDQAAAIVKMAEDAKNAATNITTFSKLVDTLKESIGSGWAQTWQIVFGDFEEARAFWSNLYNGTISPMISSMSNARNTLLSSALGGGDNAWVKFNEQLQAAGVSLDTFQGQMDAVATENGKSLGDLIAKYGNLKTALASGEISADMVSEALGRINDGALLAADGMDDLIGTMTQKSGRLLLLDGLTNILEALLRPLQAVGNAFGQVFGLSPNGLYNIIEAFNRFTEAIVINDDTMDKLTRTFKGVFSILKIFTTLMGGTFGIAVKAVTLLLENFDIGILDVTAAIGDALSAISDFILSGNILTEGFGLLVNAAKAASPALADFFASLAQYPLIQGIIQELNGFKAAISGYIHSFDGLSFTEALSKLYTDAQPVLKQISITARDAFNEIVRYMDSVAPEIRSGLNALIDRFPGLSSALETARQAFQNFTSSVSGYFKELLQLSPAEALSKIVNDIRSMFNNLNWNDVIKSLKSFIGNFDGFVDSLTTGFKSLAPDILDGLIDGLGEGIKAVVDIMTTIGGRIIDAIKLVLGIHSPSTVMFEIGTNIMEGLYNGMSSTLGTVVDFISSVATTLSDTLSNINWGAVAVTGISAGTLAVLFQFAKALQEFGKAATNITAPAKGVGDVLTSISKAIDVFAGNAKGSKFLNIANGLKTIAEAVAIVAGAVAALTLVDTDKMWQAVGAIGAIAGGMALMAGVMVGLSAVMGKFKLGSFKDIATIDGLVLSISGSFALLAIAMKIMGSLDDKALDKGIKVMERFQLLLANVVLIGGIFGKGVDFTSIGKLMTKLATTFLLASVAIRIIGGMEADQIKQATDALGQFSLMLMAIVAVGALINTVGGSVDSIGSTMLKLSAAIGIMALVCRMLGSVDPGALTQGIIATGALSLFIVGLIAATKIIAGKQIAQIGNTLLSISASIAILAGVAVALSGIDPSAFDNGLGSMTKVAALVLGIIGVMELISKFGKTDLIKVGASLLLVSASVAILAGVAVLLSTIDTAGLTKGIIAVGFLSLFVAGMIAACKGAEKAKGTIIAVSVAVGILAAAVAALSFIPFEKLAPATAALAILMGMFALIVQSSKNVNASVGTIVTMSLVVTLLAGILIAMSALDVQNAMTNAVALSLLMAMFAVSLEVMDNVKGISTSAMVALTLMAAIMAILALVLAAMSALDVQNAMPNAVALGLLLTTMTALLMILSNLNVSIPAAAQAAGALSAFIVVLGGVLTAIGALTTLFPKIQEFIDIGGQIFEGIGIAIGKLIGGIGEGIMDAISNSLPGLGTALSTFAINLLPFITTMKMVDDSVINAVSALATAILKLTAGSFLDAIASFLGDNGIENLGTKLLPLADAMKSFSSQCSDINQEGLNKGVQAATALSDVLNGLPPAGAWQKISGQKEWGTLSTGLADVATAMDSFAENAADIDQAGMDKGVQAATALNKLLNKLPDSSVWDSLFDGEKSWSTIGDGLAEFGDAMQSFSESVSDEDFSVENIKESLKAAAALNDFQGKLPDSSWLSEVWGGDSAWTEFGDGLADMGAAMAGYSKALAEDYKPKLVMQSLDALKKFIPAIQSLGAEDAPNLSGISTGFITAANQLGVGLRQYSEEVSDINIEAVSASIDPMKKLVGAVQSLGGKKAPDLSGISTGFITAANQLGVGLRQYSEEVANVVPETVTGSLDPLKSLVSTVQSLGGKGSPDLSGISVGFITAANQLGVGLRQYYEEVANIVPETVSASTGPLQSLSDTISGLAGKDFSGASAMKTAIDDADDFGLNKFGEGFASKVTTASTNMQTFVTNLTNFGTNLSSAVGVVNSATSSISTAFATTLSSAISATAAGISTAGALIVLSLISLASQVVAFAATWQASFLPMNVATIVALTTVMATIGTFNQPFKTAGSTLSSNLVSGMQQNQDGIRTAFNGNLNSAVNNIRTNYWQSFYSAGTYVASGFAAGIRKGASMAVNAAANMASQAIEAANATADINSPSRVMMKSGVWFTEGFAKGIGNAASEAITAAKSMVGRSISSVTDAINSDTTLDALDIDVTPTITPRLDLTSLRSDARSISSIVPNKLDLGNEVGLAGAALGSTRSIQNAKVTMEYERDAQYNRSNAALRNEIRDLRSDMGSYQKAVESQETAVYVDGKKLASTIAKPMNQQLGIRSRRGSLSRT